MTFDEDGLRLLRAAIRKQTAADDRLLQDLLTDVRGIRDSVRAIRRRTTTSVSLVASDGGNNKLAFDPFYVQLIRVVDSLGGEEMLGVVSPSTDPDQLSLEHLAADGDVRSPLGRLMKDLGAKTLRDLSPMVPDAEKARKTPELVAPGWVLTYRDLCEWAVLYERLCYREYAGHTLFVRDGLLRSKVFQGDLFVKMIARVEAALEDQHKRQKRRIFLVGVAKHSQVLARYRLAMALEDSLPRGDSYFVPVPREMERKAYRWPEYARGVGEEEGEERAKFVGGRMHFVRFGRETGDPVWAVDLLNSQVSLAAEVFGYLLGDATDGFPVPFYPRCLQKAHEHAEIVDFDLDVLQDEVYAAVRALLPAERQALVDRFKLTPDPSGRRYE